MSVRILHFSRLEESVFVMDFFQWNMKGEPFYPDNRYPKPPTWIRSPDSRPPGELPSAADVGQELQPNNSAVMGKTMKRDKETSGQRDAPQKYPSKWTREQKEGKSISNAGFQVTVNNLCCLRFFKNYLFSYLASFQQPVCGTFQKTSSRSPALYFFICSFFTLVSSMRSKADMNCWPLQNV